MKKIVLSVLAAALFNIPVLAAEKLDVKNNERPIHIEANDKAIAKIPANFNFVNPVYLTVASEASNSPPIGLWASDNKTLIGSDPDIARLLAESLGLKLKLVPAAWEDWPLGITAGRYDVALFNIAVTEERKKKFDFATYRAENHSFEVKANSTITAIDGRKDLAGKRVIVASGTNQEKILIGWDEKNRAEGLTPIQLVYLTDDVSATLALQSGRADIAFGPESAAAWKVASRGQTKVVGQGPFRAWVAVTTKKGNGLDVALQEAINGAIASGHYKQVLTRWGEEAEAVDSSQINPPGIVYQ